MSARTITSSTMLTAFALAALTACWVLALDSAAMAQAASPAPVEASPPPLAPESAPLRHHIVVERSSGVEAANARVKLREDAWVYSRPTKMSKHVARVHAGKYVRVTGSTRYYLRVELKDGPKGYVSPSAVDLVMPTDKIFALTSDSPVYQQPNRWARKISEVHKGHGVHVVGVALDYMKIKMKSGLEGYIPQTALE